MDTERPTPGVAQSGESEAADSMALGALYFTVSAQCCSVSQALGAGNPYVRAQKQAHGPEAGAEPDPWKAA